MKQLSASVPTRSQHHPYRRVLGAAFVSLLLFGLALYGFVYRQAIIDQFVVWNFQPSSSVQETAKRAGLSDTGTFYLYASQTAIVDQAAFNTACGSLQTEQSVVLGCYVAPERKIYIYNVSDPRLDGVIEATAAHEMLHAAYDRLGTAERQQIDTLLRDEQSRITDQRLKTLIALYEKTEPGQLLNELHSIVATEIRDVSPELETYYTRYFSDRSAVVTLTEAYEKLFSDLQQQQDALVNELNTLTTAINERQTTYSAAIVQLNADIATFNAWAKTARPTESEFMQRRNGLDVRIAALESERKSINTAISTYNKKKAELDELNLKARDLNKSINSKVLPTPSI